PMFRRPRPPSRWKCLPAPASGLQPRRTAVTNRRNRPTVTSKRSRRKVLTVAYALCPSSRAKRPPSTTKLAQQLSFALGPQSVKPDVTGRSAAGLQLGSDGVAPSVDTPSVDAPSVDAPSVDAPSVDAPSVDMSPASNGPPSGPTGASAGRCTSN